MRHSGLEGEAGFMNLEGSRFDPLINPTLTVAAFRGTPDGLGSARVGGKIISSLPRV